MNNKKEVVPLRTRKGSIYQKGSNEIFKISRSKFSNFIDCPRCFYLERVKGLKDPSTPKWILILLLINLFYVLNFFSLIFY